MSAGILERDRAPGLPVKTAHDNDALLCISTVCGDTLYIDMSTVVDMSTAAASAAEKLSRIIYST